MHATTEPYPTPAQLILTDVGPCLHDGGVTYRVWAMGRREITVHVEKSDREKYVLPLEPADAASGYFHVVDPDGAAGDLYQYAIDGNAPLPDFLSHFQPLGVFGPSMVVDGSRFAWQAADWKRPVWNGHVIYECHVGTFTPAGTFRAAIGKLDHLVSLGISALELMPLAEFAGQRNWGYDGVMPFAPAHIYGSPDDLRALVDACHLRGLAVILDVVYNHLGPEGNFSHAYSDFYFHQGKDNPWGQNFNLDGPHSRPVRAMLHQNIRYWLDEFRIDGFRMDATHAIHDESRVPLMAEIADLVHGRGGFIIAEDERNERKILEPGSRKGWGFDAVWSDDFHHVLRVSQTGERASYLSMFDGAPEEIARVIRDGWLYSGQFSPYHGRNRGTPAADFPSQSFVVCISNHDQAGNRWQGARLGAVIDPAQYRALSLLLCLAPGTPLLFMGQEWNASTPFHYFTDMPDELGAKIVEGRGREYLENGFIADPSELDRMANPQAESTFLASKLDWNEPERPACSGILALYKAGLDLRRALFSGINPPRSLWRVQAQENSVTIHYQLPTRNVLVYFRARAGRRTPVPKGELLLGSNAPEFAGPVPPDSVETLVLAVS